MLIVSISIFCITIVSYTKSRSINGVLKNQRASIQLTYQSVFCLWLLSFSQDIAASFPETPVITRLVDLLKTHAKEKIQRIVLATLRVRCWSYVFAIR